MVAFYPLLPDRMEVGRTEKVELFYCYQKDGRDYLLRPDEVLHVPGLSFDGLAGYSPIAMAKNAIGIAMTGDLVFMSPTAMLTIYNPATFVWGDEKVYIDSVL